MSRTICGADCSICMFKDKCAGCIETNGRPYKKDCIVAVCCHKSGYKYCSECMDCDCSLKQQVITEINALGIKDMPNIECLNELKGSVVNLSYTFPGGQSAKIWDDDKIYLGYQINKLNSDRFYGVTADENYLLVCEYNQDGSDAEIVVYKKRRG